MVCLQLSARAAFAAASFFFAMACWRPPLTQSQHSSGTTTQSADVLHSFVAVFGFVAGDGEGEAAIDGVGVGVGFAGVRPAASLGSKRMTIVGSS